MTIELIPLATMVAELEQPFILDGTPAGGRWIFEVASVTIEGERLRASLKGRAAADWLVAGPDGTGTLDVRTLLETHDGALVFVQYNGRVDLTAAGAAPTYTAPRFETGDDRYRWLNRIQAVGKGTLSGSKLTYELYELR
jgi:hypothetical protein